MKRGNKHLRMKVKERGRKEGLKEASHHVFLFGK